MTQVPELPTLKQLKKNIFEEQTVANIDGLPDGWRIHLASGLSQDIGTDCTQVVVAKGDVLLGEKSLDDWNMKDFEKVYPTREISREEILEAFILAFQNLHHGDQVCLLPN